MKNLLLLLVLMTSHLFIASAMADSRFQSQYPCSDVSKTCASKGVRTIEGLTVHRDCWEWQYTKQCNYPSKNDCRLYEHCYAAGDRGCLLQDSLGNCVNMKREFSCKAWNVVNKKDQTARMGFEDKPGKDGLICKGIPCIDGNCVDKRYSTNGEMMDSLSKLHATAHMKPDKEGNFNLFQGSGMHCSKKPLDYTNCCKMNGKGWGANLGAKCNKDERTLSEMRGKNLCVYAGKDVTKKAGITVVIKHRYCCFGNMLDKVIQVEGRKQLGKNFGSGKRPDCSGLSLEEIKRINWSQVDFSEFINELKVKFAGDLKIPNAGDLKSTITSSMPNMRRYDDNPHNQKNNMSGWNGKMQDDSWEANEESRVEAANIERERAGRIAEQNRQAKLLNEQRGAKKLAKQREVDTATREYQRVDAECWNYYKSHGGKMGGDARYRNEPWYPEYYRLWNIRSVAKSKADKLERELKRGQYE